MLRPTPHLNEVCSLLARGLLRLSSQHHDEIGGEASSMVSRQKDLLHFIAQQSGHATPSTERDP
jgi:hypothetical protein